MTLRWTDQDLAEYEARKGRKPSAMPTPAKASQGSNAAQPKRYKQGVMNRTEAEYAQKFLDSRISTKEIKGYWFEKVTLRLGYRTSYTPDFFVERADGTFEFHETKGGFVRDDALAKFKIAAGMFPFKFFLCQKVKGEWTVKEF